MIDARGGGRDSGGMHVCYRVPCSLFVKYGDSEPWLDVVMLMEVFWLVLQPIGPFGTEANPVEVESIFDERIMGCPGDCAGGDTRANNEVRCALLSLHASSVV